MGDEHVRRQVKLLVGGFAPPHGLRERIAASAPGDKATSPLRWVAAVAAILVALALVAILLTSTRLAQPVPALPDPWKALQARPLPPPPPGLSTLSNACTSALPGPSYVSGGPYERAYVKLSTPTDSRYVSVTGPDEVYAGQPANLMFTTTYAGPVLVRLHRLDGADGGELILLDKNGQARGLIGREIRAPNGGSPRTWLIGLTVNNPGCYALQIDTASLSELVVFTAQPPPPAPGTFMTTPAGAAEIVHKAVTVGPVLLPAQVPAGWQAYVKVSEQHFLVSYVDPASGKTLVIANDAANPPPHDNGAETHPNFHGDPHSVYQSADKNDPKSDRILMWTESGTPYSLSATGMTDAEFWALANSLAAS